MNPEVAFQEDIALLLARSEGTVDRVKLLGPLLRYTFATTEFIWLYAIQAGEGGGVKIGVTRKPSDRIKTLQTANAANLIGLAAWRALPGEEKDLHDHYAHLHIRGEWFEPAPELIDYVLLRGADFCDWEKESA